MLLAHALEMAEDQRMRLVFGCPSYGCASAADGAAGLGVVVVAVGGDAAELGVVVAAAADVAVEGPLLEEWQEQTWELRQRRGEAHMLARGFDHRRL
jgi:hypothetical protein